MKKLLLIPFIVVLTIMALPVTVGAQNIVTIAGCGIGDDSLATKAEIIGPVCVTMDKLGNTYVSQAQDYRIRKISTSGIITTFAGNGFFGNTGDGGPATAATIGVVYGLAFDKHGNLFFSDIANNSVRMINTAGIVTTVAGIGSAAYSGDGGPATAAELNGPVDIAIDSNDNIFIADFLNNVVRKINSAGIISTAVGDGSIGSFGYNGPATASELGRPFRITIDNKGNLYVAEVFFQCICKVDTGGMLTIIADTTGTYATGADGDGGLALDATMTSPCGLAVDTSGHLFFSDIGNDRIRMIDLNTGIISNYAASGTAGYGGDGGPATGAMICTPEGLFCDLAGNLLISDADNNRVRKVTASTGVITTFAGQNGLFGEGYPATNAEMCTPANIATDASGNIYFADFENNRIRKIDAATGIVTTVAGSGIAGYDDGYNGDGGPATAANIYNPSAVAVDNSGNIYICDQNNQRIRKVNTAGIISTIAGNGNYGYSGDNGPATDAKVYSPSGIAVDAAGNVYIADTYNLRIRKISTAGIITTVAGNGLAGFSGDGGAATAAKLRYPVDLSFDGAGNMYIADAENQRIRKVDTSGNISTIAGTGVAGWAGDGGAASLALLNYPSGIKADNIGNVYIADGVNQRVRIINTAGIINSFAGNGTIGFSGDGGPATAAALNGPSGVAVDQFGNLYIADGGNRRIRKTTSPFVAVPTVNAFAAASVFPNPVSGQLTVTNAAGSQLTITDLLGKVVKKMVVADVRQTIDIKDMAPGLYLLHLANDHGGSRSFKIIKE